MSADLVSLVDHLEVTSVLRLQGPEDESPRYIDDHDGDIQVKIEEGGRFSVLRYLETTHTGERRFKLIGNYGPAWSIEDVALVRYTQNGIV